MSERKINILGVGEYKKNLEDVTHYIDDCINRLSSSVKNLSSDIIKGDLADRLDEAYDKLYKVRNEVNQELDSFTDWLGENIENSTLLDERHVRELENELNSMDFFKDGYTISGGNAFLTGDNNLTFNTPATSQSSEKEKIDETSETSKSASIVDSNLYEKYKNNPNAPWSNEAINEVKENQMKEEVDKIMNKKPWENSFFNIEALKETKATSSNATKATSSNATKATSSNATKATSSNATLATQNNATLATQSNGTTETGRFYIPDLKKYENNSNGSLSNGTTATGKYDNSHLNISEFEEYLKDPSGYWSNRTSGTGKYDNSDFNVLEKYSDLGVFGKYYKNNPNGPGQTKP